MIINKNELSVLLVVGLLSWTVSANAERPIPRAVRVPDGFSLIGNLGPTFYWVSMERETGEAKNTPVIGTRGEELARVSYSYYRDLVLEGTGRLLDGRTLNYAGAVTLPGGSTQYRFRECGPEAPYGYGAGGRSLVPFRSVAVDPKVIRLDSEVFIPAAVGVKLPDGSIHDGRFRAVDVGGAIQGQRIDIFTSYGDQSRVFSPGIQSHKPTSVYVKAPGRP